MPEHNPNWGNIYHINDECREIIPIFKTILESKNIPGWLSIVIFFALQQQCSYIIFDRDASTIEELPSWKW